MQVDWNEFADGPDGRWKRKRGVEDDTQTLGLSIWRKGAAVEGDKNGCSRTGFRGHSRGSVWDVFGVR